MAIGLFLVLGGGRAGAQVPVGAETMSPKAVAESIAVLRTLDDALSRNHNDAASFFREGMVAWALALRASAKPAVGGLNQIKYNRMADTSLRIAAQIAPGIVQYQLAIGVFLRYSPDPTARLGAIAFLDAAAAAARAEPDPAKRATALLEAGRIHWLRYDSEAHHRLYLKAVEPPPNPECPNGLPTAIDGAYGIPELAVGIAYPKQVAPTSEGAAKIIHNLFLACTQTMPDAGGSDYAKAEVLFRDAVAADPKEPRAFRQLAMLLAEKDRWTELELVARTRASGAPDDPNAWLALGLALHRERKSDRAAAAFDTAFTRLSAPERGRLRAFTRLLNTKDSAAYARSTAATRERTESQFWALSDPLWSRPGDEPETEFLARVTYAELRWTVEELGVRGADSDRGEIYVRYGPPDSIGTLRGGDIVAANMMSQSGFGFSPGGSGSGIGSASQSDVITFWDYDNGFFAVFWGAPTYGTAHFPVADEKHIATLEEARSAAFDNVATERIEPIPLRTARFRAPGDSVDMLFLTQAPVKEIHAGTAANSPIREDTWLFGRDVPNAYRDSLTLDGSGTNARTYRVPQSAYMYRVEATADGASVAGRATTWITAGPDTTTGFATRGFGISDLLLATHAAPRVDTPARWRDFNIAPLLGALPAKSNFDLVWENYEFGQRGGQALYQITLTIQRQRSAAGKIAAQIVGAVAGAVGITQRADRVILQFDRSGAAAPMFVDHLTVALGDTPPGSYRLLLEVTDRVTGRKTNRATDITIQP